MAALTARFRVLRYDLRGHGGSDATPGDYTIERLGRDALALLDRLGLDRVAWCGVSLGGHGRPVAGRARRRSAVQPRAREHVAAHRRSRRHGGAAPHRARRRDGGAIVDTAMARFFGDALVAANPPRLASARETFLATDPVGYAGCCAALRDFDGASLLPRIAARTLVVSGDDDASMPWEAHGAALANGDPRRGGRPPGDRARLEPRAAADLHADAARVPRRRRRATRSRPASTFGARCSAPTTSMAGSPPRPT